jgi:hypothetical protein
LANGNIFTAPCQMTQRHVTGAEYGARALAIFMRLQVVPPDGPLQPLFSWLALAPPNFLCCVSVGRNGNDDDSFA